MNFLSNYFYCIEPIEVKVTITNPLQIPIQLYSCQLQCDHYDIHDELSLQGIPSEPLPKDADGAFTVTPIDFLLAPEKSQTISLVVTPLRQGLLEIRGLVFNLCGAVWCCKLFPEKKKRLQTTKQNRVTGATELDLHTSIEIVEPMPLLSIDFPSFPNFLYQGEIRQFNVKFTNIGKESLKNVAVKLSHPGLFVFASGTCDTPCGSNPFNTLSGNPVINSTGPINDTYDLSIAHLPIDHLEPGESTSVVMWVRGGKIGNHQCKFVFYYEPDTEKHIKYRVQREQVQFGVVPSIRASFWINPSIKEANSYTLGVQFHGVQSNIGFNLLQLTSVSSHWKIDPLSFATENDNS